MGVGYIVVRFWLFSFSYYFLFPCFDNHHSVNVLALCLSNNASVLYLQIYVADTRGNGFYREGKIIGVDPAYDLAVLKVCTETVT